jgi:hypothetical protein
MFRAAMIQVNDRLVYDRVISAHGPTVLSDRGIGVSPVRRSRLAGVR